MDKRKDGMRDMMWSMFWMTRDAQKADIDALEADIKMLIQMTTQKTAGQRRDKIRFIANEYGFDIEERVVLRDKQSGKIYR